MKNYDHKKIESKWQKEWEKKKLYKARDKGEKSYILVEFPYPSGDGLHVGHVRSYTALDVVARKRRMEGKNVMYPMGWDAFGLPAESYAVKTGIHPEITTKKNIANFKKQMQSLGLSFDWSREVNTTDPKYYKWTQWIFLQFLKAGLAYKAKTEINWCPKDKIGLANEEVVDGKCERCGTLAEKREKEQWMLAITKYAERLDKDLDTVDYPDRVKTQQRNWIGKSEGALIKFDDIEVFTTRPDTIFGATFLVVAGKQDKFTGKYVTNPATKEKIPVWEAEYVYADYGTGAIMAVPAHDERDFEFAKKHNLPIVSVVERLFVNEKDVDAYHKDEKPVERSAVVCVVKHWKEDKYLCSKLKKIDWKGFVVGGIEGNDSIENTAVREVTEETGYRNIKFIKSFSKVHSKFYQNIKKENRFAHFHPVYLELIDGEMVDVAQHEKDIHDIEWINKKDVENYINREDMKMVWSLVSDQDFCFTGHGILTNSGKFDGMDSLQVKKEIIKFVGGKEKTSFKLRDWIFSRQRYWGEPIPVIHCEKCGVVPVPDKDLPVKLPKVKKYAYTDTGESPLANVLKWVNTKCPKCKGKARRETDTMPNWAGSSWYFYRYADPKNTKAFADPKKLKYWQPVDWYNGGMEHTTLHLLYSRFWNKFLYDQKLVPTSEPYAKRTSHGLILAEGGAKMAKSVGNVVNPDDITKVYGADTLRVYEMFLGPFEQSVSWSEEAIIGPRRFLERVWKLASQVQQNSSASVSKLLNKTIKKVGEDIESMSFNTAVSALMVLLNEMDKGEVSKKDFEKFLQLLAPFAPHIAEELWITLGNKKTITLSKWPKWDESLMQDEEIKIIVQVNGKLRGEIMINSTDTEEAIKEKGLKNEAVLRHLNGQNPKKVIYVKNRLINIVT